MRNFFAIAGMALLTTCATAPAHAFTNTDIDVESFIERVDYQVIMDKGSCSSTMIDVENKILATAAHCVIGMEDDETVQLVQKVDSDEGYSSIIETTANVLSVDKDHDLALIQMVFGSPFDMTEAKLSKLPVSTGQEVYVVGHPMGMPIVMMTKGIVTNEDPISSFGHIGIDAVALAGNSGGGVFNTDGEMVGVLVAGMTTPTIQSSAPLGINFMIPVKYVQAMMDSLEG